MDKDEAKANGTTPLEESPRFAKPPTRRDFLGLMAKGSCAATLAAAGIGALRLPMPAVFPESNAQVKVGKPETFPPGSATHIGPINLWLFHKASGFYAISAICTHLGCIVSREGSGEFLCPCHGSQFSPDGSVKAGPAPKGLNWLKLSLSPDGQLVVDQMQNVKPGVMFSA